MSNPEEKFALNDISAVQGGYIKANSDRAINCHYKELSDGTCLFSVLDSDKIPGFLLLGKEFEKMLVEQAQQVKMAKGRSTLCWAPGDFWLVYGPHPESFISWITPYAGKDNVWLDRFLHATVIKIDHWPEETPEKLSYCGVTVTSAAASRITPRSKESVKLAGQTEKAKLEGFRVPDKEIFPTERTLMDHQEPVSLTLAYHGGGLLADDVGSGKSSMFLCGFLSLAQYVMEKEHKSLDEVFPLVVVTKKALVSTIDREAQLWFEGSKTFTFSGTKTQDVPEGTHIIFCPLNTLHHHVESIIECQPKGVVFDESHMVKNLSAKRTQAALELSEWIKDNNSYPYVVCASATPMPNRPAELWAQLKITGMDEKIIEFAETKQIFPKRVKTKSRSTWLAPVDDQKKFEIRYCDGKTGFFAWDNRGATNKKELSDLLHDGGLIRRKKSEFLTPLPALTQNTVAAKLTEDYRAKYELAEEEFYEYLSHITTSKGEKEGLTEWQIFDMVKDKLSKAQRAEAIVKMTSLSSLIGEAKIDAAAEWIERFFDHDPTIVGEDKSRNKLIVFAHHKIVQEKLVEREELQKHGVLAITAGEKHVNEKVDQFQDPESGKNIMVCYSEAREGLTLTAAKDVLVVELPFIPSHIIQMAGRMWARFSEKYAPHEGHIHLLVSDTSIDDYLSDLLKEKGILNREIIDGEFAADMVNAAESGDIEPESEFLDKLDKA